MANKRQDQTIALAITAPGDAGTEIGSALQRATVHTITMQKWMHWILTRFSLVNQVSLHKKQKEKKKKEKGPTDEIQTNSLENCPVFKSNGWETTRNVTACMMPEPIGFNLI
jgi:hypothetical protein